MSYKSPKFVEHPVGDRTINFYPVSVGASFAMKAVAKPLAKALTTLFSSTEKMRRDDHGLSSKSRDIQGPKEDGGFIHEEETNREAVPLATIEMRLRTSQEAVQEAIEAICADSNRGVIGMLLQDSMREEFTERHKITPQVAAKWLSDEVDLVIFREMIVGLAKANREVLGPLGEIVSTKYQAAVDAALKEDLQTSSPEKEISG